MNTDSKLPHAIFGSVLSWFLTVISWAGDHVGTLAGCFAILASCATIWAGVETALLMRKRRNKPEADE